MRTLRILFAGAAFLMLAASCKQKSSSGPIDGAAVLHENEDQLTNVIIYDVFTPPVASRIYGYTSLAAYEAIRYADPKYNSITAQLRGFGAPPEPEQGKKYNYTLAATKAFFTVAHKVTFSVDTLKKYEDKVFARFKDNLDEETYNRSVDFGEKIGNMILKRANVDHYPQTRGKPKYLGSDDPGNGAQPRRTIWTG